MRKILASAELGAFENPLVFKNADSSTVMHKIEETLSNASGEDQVLIYYSGHGTMDLLGLLYLPTINTEVKRLVTTSIPIEMLRLMIENSPCRKLMLILDDIVAITVGTYISFTVRIYLLSVWIKWRIFDDPIITQAFGCSGLRLHFLPELCQIFLPFLDLVFVIRIIL